MTLDRRLHAFRADLADIRLRGAVAAPRYVEGLPARVALGCAPVRREPEASSGLETYWHYGEAILVFERSEPYSWSQSGLDGTVGYVETRAIDFAARAPATHHVATLGSYVYASPDLRGAVVDFLPRHSEVIVAESGIMTRGTDYARLEPGGFLPLACLSPEPPRSSDLASAALLYEGAPYLWAGRSAQGLDCSGLVQSAFRDLGIAVPRDTDQQCAAIGDRVVVAHGRDLVPGDLLYLSGHVTIALGAGSVIHADGASMTVRREGLAAVLARLGLDLAALTLRRHPQAGPRPPAQQARRCSTSASAESR
jgi:hypothetical protein